ncbi:MAG: mannose-1-phosphate guanylyltransferase [Candidatus Omnitrophica bacterium]|nr:mannose-1-phosphate guanylyltransferase [Candidatus Omnitrophota bacterium]
MTIPRSRYWGVLLAGGQGERLWPWSRRDCPKQFLTISGGRSLLQHGYARLAQVAPPDQIYVIGSAAHARAVRAQLPSLSPKRWVGEAVGRNTAAAIGTGAFLIGRDDPGAVMVVATADHVIEPARRWAECVRVAGHIALEDVDRLVCFGVPPTSPMTGYGYLIPGPTRLRRRLAGGRVWAAPLARFVEKPSARVARQLIRRGALWNSGMFVWSIPAIARALQHHMPQITRGLVLTVKAPIGTRAFNEQLASVYRRVPSISIDYGVMEQAIDCWMVHGAFAWDDVGSWTRLASYLPHDRDGNAVRGRHLGLDTHRTLVLGGRDHLIATLGVRDLIIAQHRGVTLVASRARAQQVRQLVARCDNDARWRPFR